MFYTSDFRDNVICFHMQKSSDNSAIPVSISDGQVEDYIRLV